MVDKGKKFDYDNKGVKIMKKRKLLLLFLLVSGIVLASCEQKKEDVIGGTKVEQEQTQNYITKDESKPTHAISPTQVNEPTEGKRTDAVIVDCSEQRYDYESMREDLIELSTRYPSRMQLNELTATVDGRTIYEAVIGNPEAKKHIIIHAGIHAREYMTVLLVMRQMEDCLSNYETKFYQGERYSELFQEIAVHVLPMMNPDGISISQFGLDGIQSERIREQVLSWYQRDKDQGTTTYSLEEYLNRWKSNANGVDLNRNFDYGWEEFSGSGKPGAEKYKGSAAGIEKEAEVLIDLTNRIQPLAAISYHATGSVIYWEYGQKGALREQCEALVDTIHLVTGYEVKYSDSDPQDAAGYGDWAVMSKGIPSATVEIGIGAAPLKIEEFPDVWERNQDMWAAIVTMYKKH